MIFEDKKMENSLFIKIKEKRVIKKMSENVTES